MGIMPINGAIKFKGGPNVMIYIEKEKGEYGIYDYSGVLMVSRKTDGNSRADELLNLDEIIAAIKKELIRLWFLKYFIIVGSEANRCHP